MFRSPVDINQVRQNPFDLLRIDPAIHMNTEERVVIEFTILADSPPPYPRTITKATCPDLWTWVKSSYYRKAA